MVIAGALRSKVEQFAIATRASSSLISISDIRISLTSSSRVSEYPAEIGKNREYRDKRFKRSSFLRHPHCLHEVVDTTLLCPCALTSDVETSFYFQEKSFVFSLGFLSSHPGVFCSFPPFCSPFFP